MISKEQKGSIATRGIQYFLECSSGVLEFSSKSTAPTVHPEKITPKNLAFWMYWPGAILSMLVAAPFGRHCIAQTIDRIAEGESDIGKLVTDVMERILFLLNPKQFNMDWTKVQEFIEAFNSYIVICCAISEHLNHGKSRAFSHSRKIERTFGRYVLDLEDLLRCRQSSKANSAFSEFHCGSSLFFFLLPLAFMSQGIRCITRRLGEFESLCDSLKMDPVALDIPLTNYYIASTRTQEQSGLGILLPRKTPADDLETARHGIGINICRTDSISSWMLLYGRGHFSSLAFLLWGNGSESPSLLDLTSELLRKAKAISDGIEYITSSWSDLAKNTGQLVVKSVGGYKQFMEDIFESRDKESLLYQYKDLAQSLALLDLDLNYDIVLEYSNTLRQKRKAYIPQSLRESLLLANEQITRLFYKVRDKGSEDEVIKCALSVLNANPEEFSLMRPEYLKIRRVRINLLSQYNALRDLRRVILEESARNHPLHAKSTLTGVQLAVALGIEKESKVRELTRKTGSNFLFDPGFRLSSETLEEIVDCARFSVSEGNIQPLKFFLSCDPKMNKRIFNCLDWANVCKNFTPPSPKNAPSGYVIVLGDKEIAQSFGYDPGMAAQVMLLRAAEENLNGCILSSFDGPKLKKILEIADRYEILLVLALGRSIEKVKFKTLKPGQDRDYMLDEKAGARCVPKRSLEESIIGKYCGQAPKKAK